MWTLILIQWLHVLLGLFWLGGSLLLNFVVIPVISNLPQKEQRLITPRLGERIGKFFLPASIGVVILGILRGTIWGPVQSVEVLFGTAYGLTWLAALIATIATILWGQFVIQPNITRLNTLEIPEGLDDHKILNAQKALVQKIAVLSLLELTGFIIIFTCMILMRFGL